MTIPPTRDDCHRNPAAKENLVENAGLSSSDIACLEILRFFISTFAAPRSQNWMRGYEHAEVTFGPTHGPIVASRLMAVLQAVRLSRRSIFTFSNPDCPGCARILTEHERRLVCAISVYRCGRPRPAGLQLMMLCEGNPTDAILQKLDDLVLALNAAPQIESADQAGSAAF
ncbi:hypothetical protein [uncultured Roseobacter sp.]|uniref:hypothetical protein n=1 Tax=uncultured Roseobacter sp. TaxID=114847 RepID=UPI002608C014|nr:hypothetical protein [uncultured Roseobacter sp.]